MRKHLLLVCAMLVWTAAAKADSAADFVAGQKVAEAYSAAIRLGDIKTAIAFAHPILRMRFGGDANYEKALRIAYVDAISVKVVKETMGAPSDEFVGGSTRMFSIPAVRTLTNGKSQTLYYVLTSYDAGKNWKVFDLACTEARWLHAIAPMYRNAPTLVLTAEVANRMTNEQFLRSTQASIVPKKPAPVMN